MTPNDLAKELRNQDAEYWLAVMMDAVPNDIDKREGSIIYDALRPAAMIMARSSLTVADMALQAYTQTASNEFLDYKAEEHGTSRYQATNTQVKATVLDLNNQPINSVSIGDRFSSLGEQPFFYTVEKINDDKTVLMRAEEAGTGPNSYLGQVLPVTPNDDLAWAEIVEITVPARDTETDEYLRKRLLNSRDWAAYGGNVADYLDMTDKISDVGATQVYPVWQGPGTVKLVILDNNLMPASHELCHQVKEMIDPEELTTKGYGLAPIDHRVTVAAPVEKVINVSVKVQFYDSKPVDETKSRIKAALEDYFKTLRERWSLINDKKGRGYDMTIYRAKLLTVVMMVDGVVNATLPKINGQEDNLALTFSNSTSELPVLGEVTFE